MNRETITDKQSIYLIIMFLLGASIIILRGAEAKQDLWLATILAILGALVVCLICARLHYIFPHNTLFDIIDICFGKFIGRLLSLMYIFFTFLLTSLLIMDFGYFFTTVTFPETPKIIFNILSAIVGAYAVKSGIEVIARWAKAFLPLLILVIAIFLFLLIQEMNIDNIYPLLSNKASSIIKGAFSAFSFPFGEIIVFTMVFHNFHTRKSPYRVYTTGLLISGMFVLILSNAYILALGIDTAVGTYFPAYLAASRISIGMVLERTEIVVAIIFSIATFAKLCICLLATCIGTSKILGFNDYRFIVMPISLMMVNVSYSLFDSVMDWFEWTIAIWPYFAFIFQVILPITILIVAEIKKRSFRNNLADK